MQLQLWRYNALPFSLSLLPLTLCPLHQVKATSAESAPQLPNPNLAINVGFPDQEQTIPDTE